MIVFFHTIDDLVVPYLIGIYASNFIYFFRPKMYHLLYNGAHVRIHQVSQVKRVPEAKGIKFDSTGNAMPLMAAYSF